MDDSASHENGSKETKAPIDFSRLLDESLDLEALARILKDLDFATQLSQKTQASLLSIRSQGRATFRQLATVQQELREVLLDVALLKRAVTALGQSVDADRRETERALVLELFPPRRPRRSVGVQVLRPRDHRKPQLVDCDRRLPICKAACCRIFSVGLTAPEVESELYNWDPRQPYTLTRTSTGCAHLETGACACGVYSQRPSVCRNYSCANDRRIWADFDQMLLNPSLTKKLETLDVLTISPGVAASISEDTQADVSERRAALGLPLASDPRPPCPSSPQALNGANG